MHLITLLGQTTSGKSEMAVEIAQKLGNTWIVNCDSRQVYQKLDIGTGKIEGRWQEGIFVYKDIPHYLIDFVDASLRYSLAQYVSDFNKLCSLKKLPDYILITGGTGLFAKAITEQIELGEVKPEFKDKYEYIKSQLSEQSIQELQNLATTYTLKSSFNESDWANQRRLQSQIIRHLAFKQNWTTAIEYPHFSSTTGLYIDIDQQILKKNITKRLLQRLESGLVKEVKDLEFLGSERLIELGLEYKYTEMYIKGDLDYDTYVEILDNKIWQYAKRQKTWFQKQLLTKITNLDEAMIEIKKNTLPATNRV